MGQQMNQKAVKWSVHTENDRKWDVCQSTQHKNKNLSKMTIRIWPCVTVTLREQNCSSTDGPLTGNGVAWHKN